MDDTLTDIMWLRLPASAKDLLRLRAARHRRPPLALRRALHGASVSAYARDILLAALGEPTEHELGLLADAPAPTRLAP